MLRFVLAGALALATTPGFAMTITSADVTDGQSFPAQFVCPNQGGKSISPELSWSDLPAGTKSLALTIFDPDAPRGGHLHWLTVDIPPATTELPQNAGVAGASPGGGSQSPNGSQHANYDGPCPPAGPAHHYHITVYALPTDHADVPPDTGPNGIPDWLKGKALGTAEIVPVFGKAN